MSQSRELFSRKGFWICLLAAALACVWVSDAFAGKNKGNGGGPSDQGLANGVAHRVAALETGLAETQAALAETQVVLDAALGEIDSLSTQVAALEARVALLEAAAAATP